MIKKRPDKNHLRGEYPWYNSTWGLFAAHSSRLMLILRNLEKGHVSLRVIFESFSAQSEGLCFQCDHEGAVIPCGVADVALRDLIDFHRIKSTEDEALHALLPEIERLANAKFYAGRFEDNGWLVIWPVDLLRYGYRRRDKSAA
jgi:hypothetical protein